MRALRSRPLHDRAIICRQQPAALILVLLFFIAAGAVVSATAEPTYPVLTGRVVDGANLLSSSQRQAITEDLEALETKTTDQLVVAILASLQGYEIEDYGYRLGRHWGIGQAGKNNGVILIVAPKERKVRIEVGRGLEGDLPDAMTKLIIENAILPRFRSDDFPGGIAAGVRDITDVLTGDAKAVRLRSAGSDDGGAIVAIIILAVWVLIAIFVLWSIIHSARHGVKAGKGRKSSGWSSDSGGSSGSSWSGGSSGGGFSGGGGSFGGGGASGGW